MKILPIIIFLLNISFSQIALPTFQAVHNTQETSAVVSLSSPQTFSYTGSEQTLTIPSSVSSITIKSWGAQGGFDGSTAGGKGGYSTGSVSVTAGDNIYIYVGGQGASGSGNAACNLVGGWNGGGNTGTTCCSNAGGGAGAGGGASDVRIGGNSLGNRVIVAGGGSGAGSNYQGAEGGGLAGGNGRSYAGVTATGGSQSAGGNAGGHYNPHSCSAGTNGALGQGGIGDGNDGGGGGGGYYGGGGGANNGQGSGGSGYIGGVSSGSTIAGDASMPNPDGGNMIGREGNGLVIISW